MSLLNVRYFGFRHCTCIYFHKIIKIIDHVFIFINTLSHFFIFRLVRCIRTLAIWFSFNMATFETNIIFFLISLIFSIFCYFLYFFHSYIFEKIAENKTVLGCGLILIFFRFFLETALPKEYGAFSILLVFPFILFKNDLVVKQKFFLCSSVILVFVLQVVFSLKIFSDFELLLVQVTLTLTLSALFLKTANEMTYQEKLVFIYFMTLFLLFEFAFFYSLVYH